MLAVLAIKDRNLDHIQEIKKNCELEGLPAESDGGWLYWLDLVATLKLQA